MTISLERTGFREIERVLGAGISTLDITEAEERQVVSRYNSLGDTLNDHWEGSPADNEVYPQGSFALGTVTRKVNRDDEVDIDLVVLRGISASSTTQSELKQDTGSGLQTFSNTSQEKPSLAESDRCWTLGYKGMHMDVLPAIPDPLASFGPSDNILITDTSVRSWLRSDPRGYASWFNSVARKEQLVKEALFASRGVDITDLPKWERKSTLQLAVQTLKRHRDLYFADRLDLRPSSIVITTLAAQAYQPEGTLFDVIRNIVHGLADHIDFVDGRNVIANPAMPEENFADYWVDEPWRASMLDEWTNAVSRDFDEIVAHSGNDNILKGVRTVLGERAVFASAQELSRPYSQARATGLLRADNTTGSLGVGTSITASRPVKDHTFHGGQR